MATVSVTTYIYQTLFDLSTQNSLDFVVSIPYLKKNFVFSYLRERERDFPTYYHQKPTRILPIRAVEIILTCIDGL